MAEAVYRFARFTRFARFSTISSVIDRVRTTGEDVTGQSEVLIAQKHLKYCKNVLRTWRKELAGATLEYEDIQQQLKGLYVKKTHVYQNQKRDLSVLQAINNEEESLLFNEQKAASRVEECKQGERESFEALSDAIQDSHEKERAQSERMKYYMRIGSLLGAIFGFLGSNFFIKRQIRQHNIEQSQKLFQIEQNLQNHQQLQLPISSIVQVKEQIVSINESIGTLSGKVDALGNLLKYVSCFQEPSKPSITSGSSPASHPPKISDTVAVGSVMTYSLVMALMALL